MVSPPTRNRSSVFFFNDTATTEIYTLPLHDALPISSPTIRSTSSPRAVSSNTGKRDVARSEEHTSELQSHVNLVCRLLLEKKKGTRYARCACGAVVAVQWAVHVRARVSARSHSALASCSLSKAAPPTPCCFFFNDPATTEIYTLSLHDALPICLAERTGPGRLRRRVAFVDRAVAGHAI